MGARIRNSQEEQVGGRAVEVEEAEEAMISGSRMEIREGASMRKSQ